MMGHQTRSEGLFYYFRLEDQVPENHLLRLIDKHALFASLAQLKGKIWIETKSLTRMRTIGIETICQRHGPNSSVSIPSGLIQAALCSSLVLRL